MSSLTVEISLAELNSILTILQQAEYLESEYYRLTMTGEQADHLRPSGSRTTRQAREFFVRAQNLAYNQSTPEDREEFFELLADLFVQPQSERRHSS
jgi:hypothetical protein